MTNGRITLYCPLDLYIKGMNKETACCSLIDRTLSALDQHPHGTSASPSQSARGKHLKYDRFLIDCYSRPWTKDVQLCFMFTE